MTQNDNDEETNYKDNPHDIHPWYGFEFCNCPYCVNTQRAVARRTRRKKKNRWGNQRKRIYERDGFKCVKCDATENLTLDHAVPKSHGGKSSDDNLQTMCKPCNNKKGATVAFYGALKKISESVGK